MKQAIFLKRLLHLSLIFGLSGQVLACQSELPSSQNNDPSSQPTIRSSPPPSASPAAQPTVSASPNPSQSNPPESATETSQPETSPASAPTSRPSSPAPSMESPNPTESPVTPETSPENPENSASSVSAFTPLSEDEFNELQAFFPEEEDFSETVSTPEANEIYQSLFIEDASELNGFIGTELTTDGGPLLFNSELTTDGGALLFTTKQVQNPLVTAPKAWKREGREIVQERIRLRRMPDRRIAIWIVRDINGNFLIDRDGTQDNPSPGTKKISERLVHRLILQKPAGDRWRVVATSQSLLIPRQPKLLPLPRIQQVRIGQLESDEARLQIKRPLALVAREEVPSLPLNTPLRLEVQIETSNQTLRPAGFIFAHAFGKRLRMFDHGQGADRVANDGIFSLALTTPSEFPRQGLQQLAIDAISTPTMADETTENYQSMAWLLQFKN